MSVFALKPALVGVLAASPVADPQITPAQTIDGAVKACVEIVHASKVEGLDKLFYKSFDAYYNPADGTVQNNAYRNGDTRPLYTFNKRMVQKGFPLTSTKQRQQQ
jgi:hypothetical protein